MKKYLWTLSVMALFAVGFTSSDEDESSSTNSSPSPQTEQNQETEAERQERERKEEAEKKIEEVKERADYYGAQDPFSHRSDAEKQCKNMFMIYSNTTVDKEPELYRIWHEIYMERWDKDHQ